MLDKVSSSILNLAGWKITGKFPREIPKKIFIAVPHTSGRDFFLGLLVRKSLNAQIKFIGKHTLFKPPLGWIMRSLGGIPINRNIKSNLVQAIVDEFDKRERFSIVLAPEGTRKKVSSFKTGFYHISKQAGIPIIPIKFDYKKKEVDFGAPFFPGENTKQDIETLENYFKGVVGHRPEMSF